jgi:hypothetical protein
MGGIRKVYSYEISKKCPLVLLLKAGWKQSSALLREEGWGDREVDYRGCAAGGEGVEHWAVFCVFGGQHFVCSEGSILCVRRAAFCVFGGQHFVLLGGQHFGLIFIQLGGQHLGKNIYINFGQGCVGTTHRKTRRHKPQDLSMHFFRYIRSYSKRFESTKVQIKLRVVLI